ncbi:MAG: NCS2 family permease, partial [[Eubacterium] sulci]|nr:NCS2 family permease [[Eubacterium] sulci]
MEKLFKLKEHGTDPRTEVIAGFTTFLSMVYILAVNPNILSAAGMDRAGIFTATAVSAAFATLCMAFFANYPVALASGMGLNAYFAYSVCIPMAEAGIKNPWTIALAAVLIEGIAFILLSLTNFREKLVNDIPESLKYGITTGIGLFITIIGLKGAGIAVASPATLVDLGHVNTPQFILALVGLLIIAVLHHFKIKGDILIGILGTWILGMIAQATG